MVKCTFPPSKWLIVCLYHSPFSSHSAFIEELDDLCDVALCSRLPCVSGHFNLNLLESRFYGDKIKNLFRAYGVSQLIFEPTSLTQFTLILQFLIILLSVCFSNNKYDSGNDVKKSFRNFNDTHLHHIPINLSICDWSLNLVDVDKIYD